MTYTSSSLGPEYTPKPILQLLGIIAFVSIFSALTAPLFHHIFGWSLPEVFGLSWPGLKQWYIWQPLSFIFIQDGGNAGIHFFYLLGLAFNLYLIWVLGSYLWERLGHETFLKLFFGAGIGAGLIAVLWAYLTGNRELLSGPGPAILGLITVWTMLNPESIVSLFGAFQLKAKWLLAGILGAILLMGISQLDFSGLIFSLSGAMIGYGYGVASLGLKSPYNKAQVFDEIVTSVAGVFRKIKNWFSRKTKKRTGTDKIVDILDGKKPKSDEEFIDEMLSKISRQGEHSLTWSEKERMRRISEKRRTK